MNMNQIDKAKRLFICFGEIADGFLEEAEATDIATARAARKRVVRNSAIGAGAGAVGVAGIVATCLLLRSRRGRRVTMSVEVA
ncbi:MAG: hypothetical protein FWE08_03515 [Oscillospiraceae bacterium]|nr:hypothetical protein [Oscillospiraceae bacterium]